MAGSTHASPSADVGLAAASAPRHVSPALDAWRRFRRHKLAVVSAVILFVMILAIAIGPWIWTVPINEIDFTARLAGPSAEHPFGTDDLGQDLLARMLYGGRISLAVGLAAMMVAIVVGTIIGAIAGISRGSVDAAHGGMRPVPARNAKPARGAHMHATAPPAMAGACEAPLLP